MCFSFEVEPDYEVNLELLYSSVGANASWKKTKLLEARNIDNYYSNSVNASDPGLCKCTIHNLGCALKVSNLKLNDRGLPGVELCQFSKEPTNVSKKLIVI